MKNLTSLLLTAATVLTVTPFCTFSEAQIVLGAPGVGYNHKTMPEVPFNEVSSIGHYYSYTYTGIEVDSDADGVPLTEPYWEYMWDQPQDSFDSKGLTYEKIGPYVTSYKEGDSILYYYDRQGNVYIQENPFYEPSTGPAGTGSVIGTTFGTEELCGLPKGTCGPQLAYEEDLCITSGGAPCEAWFNYRRFDEQLCAGKITYEDTSSLPRKVDGFWNVWAEVNGDKSMNVGFNTSKLADSSGRIIKLLDEPIVYEDQEITLQWHGAGNTKDPDGYFFILGDAIKEAPIPTGELMLQQTVYSEGAKPPFSWNVERPGSGG